MATYRITHPMADEISVQQSEYHMCRVGLSAEIAFFLNKEWVVNPIPEFAEYHDGSDADSSTAVYGYVPLDMIGPFLDEFDAVKIR